MEIACACGRRHSLSAAAAGAEIVCACGQVLVAPRLSAFASVSLRVPGAISPAEEEESAQRVRQFRQALTAATPRLISTPAIVAANVLVFGIMVACGVPFISPPGEVIVEWGANFGPKTMRGEWWRLVTAMFLHFGALHLGFNVWVLWELGKLVERLVGNVGFLVLYFISGIAGSIASLAWHPIAVCAGASGAVFGVAGALLGLMTLGRDRIPLEVLKPLRNSMLSFLFYNLAFGMMVPGIDMAAHLGGLAAGFLCGLMLAQPLSVESLARRRWRNLATLLTGTVALPVAALALPAAPPDVHAELQHFEASELQVLGVYNGLIERAQGGAVADGEFATVLERDVLPPWNELRQRLETLRDSPYVDRAKLSRLTEYMQHREASWRLRAEGLREQDATKLRRADEQWSLAEEVLQQLHNR